MPNVQVKPLSRAEVAVHRGGATGSEEIDPAPLVLWAGAEPSAVLRVVTRVGPGRAEGELALSHRVESVAGRAGAYAVTAEAVQRAGAARGAEPDLLDLHRLVPADVNGDGTEELVVLRRHGAVEVVGGSGVLHRLAPPGGTGSFAPLGVQRARVGGADVVLVLLERVGQGDGDRSLLLRVDRQGITPVPVGGGEVLAVGGVSRPGSKGLDELLLVKVAREGERPVLARHAPDGRQLAEPRAIYVPFVPSRALEFWFQPESPLALLHGRETGHAFFIEAEKPVNWIHAVDLRAVARSGAVRLLGVLDRGSDAKVLFAADERIFAVDRDGRCHVTGASGLAPAASPAPLLTLSPPEPGDELGGVFPADEDGPEWVAAYSRPHGRRQPPHDEILAMAKRHFGERRLAAALEGLEPSLVGHDPLRDDEMEKERKRRGVSAEIRTAEDWRRLLPGSWEAVARARREGFDTYELSSLEEVRDPELAADPDEFRDPGPLKAWLDGLERPGRVVIVVGRRGAVAGRLVVPGKQLPTGAPSELARPPVALRARGSAVVAVLPLLGEDAREGSAAVLSEVRGTLEVR